MLSNILKQLTAFNQLVRDHNRLVKKYSVIKPDLPGKVVGIIEGSILKNFHPRQTLNANEVISCVDLSSREELKVVTTSLQNFVEECKNDAVSLKKHELIGLLLLWSFLDIYVEILDLNGNIITLGVQSSSKIMEGLFPEFMTYLTDFLSQVNSTLQDVASALETNIPVSE